VTCREQPCVTELLTISETVIFTVRMSRNAVVTVPVDMLQFEEVVLLLADGQGERHSVCLTVCKQGIATSHFHELGYCLKAGLSIWIVIVVLYPIYILINQMAYSFTLLYGVCYH
jgi:hypothetical protein